MVKIYLASAFGRKEEMRRMRDTLTGEGYEVTSRWIDVEHGLDTNGTDEQHVANARMDIYDVLRADVLLAFSGVRGSPGAGCHVEFGVALSHDKLIIVVGPKGEHIFHYLPKIQHCATLDEALDALSLFGGVGG